MRIRYCIVTLNQLEWVIDKHLPSVDLSLIDGIHVHVSEIEEQRYNGSVVVDPLEVGDLAAIAEKSGDWKVTSSVNNLGVSTGWNYFIESARQDGFDAVIIANDDIYLYEGTLQRFVDEMKTSKFVSFRGMNAFSFFGIHLDYAEQIGEFDEEFWPAYFEDNDYHYRMKLQGFEGTTVEEPSYFHAGSATLSTFSHERRQMHHHNFNKNKRYYIAKWGGLPGYEFYTTPFNGSEDYRNVESRLVKTVINGIEQITDDA